MARTKKEEVQEVVQDIAPVTQGVQDTAQSVLDALAKQVDIPDDKPAGITLRDQAVLHLLSGADLHRIAPDAVTHRIKRCIDIANQVIELLGEQDG